MRTYKRKTTRGAVTIDRMKEAAEEVLEHSRSCRSVAKHFGICHVTLMRFVRKLKRSGGATVTVGYKRNRQVFSDAQEAKLAEYLQNASAIYYGLTPTSVRKLAFECAVKFSISVPATLSRWLELIGLLVF